MANEDSNSFLNRRQMNRAGALGLLLPAFGYADAPEAGASTLIDVRRHGAKGDGKSDDTRALQSAIDAAAQGGAVFVPPGVYLSGELQLRPHVSLVGIPAWNYGGPAGTVLRLNDPHAASLLNITGARGVTIDGLALDGAGLGKGIHGILLNKPDYGKHEDTFRIERTQVARFSGDGVRLVRAWCFSIRHCMIAYSGGDGISLRGWDGFLLDNWLSGNRGAGFGARQENASCTFTGNRIEWNGEGVVIAGGDGYNFTGNFFDRSGGCALVLRPGAGGAPCSQMNITGNFFKRSGKDAPLDSHDSAQLRMEGARGVTFVGNNLQVGRDDGGQGRYSPSYGIVYGNLQNCVIANNVLHDGALKQLFADLGGHAEGVVVKDNPGSLFQPRG